MRLDERLTKRLRDAVIGEAGFAVPTVMLALFAAFALAGAAVIASVDSQRGTVRDHDTKQALAAAEAGVNDALLNFNRIAHTEPTCVVGSLADGWCHVGSQTLTGVSGASYSYAVRPTDDMIEIVATGIADGVSRRVQVTARSASGINPFGSGANVIGRDWIKLLSNASITANVATNGSVTMDSNAELTCEFAQVGPGQSVNTQSNATYTCAPPVTGTVSLPPVNQGDVATNNQNGYFFGTNTYTGEPPSWNPSTRRLTVGGNTNLVLNTGNYSLCRLETDSNAKIFLAAGASVRIYFDSPEACGLGSNSYQLQMRSNSRITPTGAGPLDVAFLFVGSDTIPTRIELNSNTQVPSGACEQDFVIYAPRTSLKLNSNSTYCGAVAAKTIEMDSNAHIKTSSFAGDFELPDAVPEHYAVEEFVECSAGGGELADTGC